MNRNVYIINKGCHDYTEAEQFGNLIYLTSGSYNILSTSKMYRKFLEQLKNSHKDDYILPTGLGVMGIVACSIFALLHNKLNLLIYYTTSGKGKGVYKERTILLDDLNGLKGE